MDQHRQGAQNFPNIYCRSQSFVGKEPCGSLTGSHGLLGLGFRVASGGPGGSFQLPWWQATSSVSSPELQMLQWSGCSSVRAGCWNFSYQGCTDLIVALRMTQGRRWGRHMRSSGFISLHRDSAGRCLHSFCQRLKFSCTKGRKTRLPKRRAFYVTLLACFFHLSSVAELIENWCQSASARSQGFESPF